MILLLSSIFILILGYIFYGNYIERLFDVDKNNETPAIKYNDGVDFVPLPIYKTFLIQFLNIAGMGPIMGAILGAQYGPVCFLWIVFGAILGGAVHDFFSGIFALRNKGQTILFYIEEHFGKFAKYGFFLFFIILLISIGATFAKGPAEMLSTFNNNIELSELKNSPIFFTWISIIFLYYFLSTFLPIDKIIAKIYPIFGLTLFAVTIILFIKLFSFENLIDIKDLFSNLHPEKRPLFPTIFIIISCGALSGFHSTQSPLMARCLRNEKEAKKVFYGSMICESFIALIWATVGFIFYKIIPHSPDFDAPIAISAISKYFFGENFAVFSILAIVFLSITSGDTAFRSARLIIADTFHIDQKNTLKRLLLSTIVLGAGIFLCSIHLTKLWPYVGWANQCIAVFTLWTGAFYLANRRKNFYIMFIPALFMTSVCISFVLCAPFALDLDLKLSIFIGIVASLALGILFLLKKKEE